MSICIPATGQSDGISFTTKRIMLKQKVTLRTRGIPHLYALTAFSAASSRSSAVINANPLSCRPISNECKQPNTFLPNFIKGDSQDMNFCPSLISYQASRLPLVFSFPGQRLCLQDEPPLVLSA